MRVSTQTATGCWHKKKEGFEGIASSFWQHCVPSRGRLGLLGCVDPELSWFRVLVPGAEGLSPASAASSLPGLLWANSLIEFRFLTLVILCLKSFVGVFLSDG